MLPLLLAVALGVPPACSAAALDRCADTNALVLSRSFRPALARFLGGLRGSYLDRNGPVLEQAIETLHGPPDEPRRLADGSWLFTACRAHSCQEKGAVAFSPAGRVLALGMLTFDCHRRPEGQAACADGPSLTLFLSLAVSLDRFLCADAISDWARDGAAADRDALGPNIQRPYRGAVVRRVTGRR